MPCSNCEMVASRPTDVGYRHMQTTRLHYAADALVTARTIYRQLAPTDPAVPRLYAGHVLAQDDDHGRLAGLVVQADAISWRCLDALEVLARRGQQAHRRDDRHPPGVTPLTCPLCAAVFALDVFLVDGLRRRRAACPDPACSDPADA